MFKQRIKNPLFETMEISVYVIHVQNRGETKACKHCQDLFHLG